MDPVSFSVVIPTIGRPCLARTLQSLAAAKGALPERIVLVRDRPGPLEVDIPARISDRTVLLTGPGRGPAAARNIGWRSVTSDWVAFLDDDVVVGPRWYLELADDLATLADAGGIQGRLTVPLPTGRPPTDWERNVAGLADARWATADMAYRRAALAEVGGFDERFTLAYREDADLALRVLATGHPLRRGHRRTMHPVRPAPWWVSLRTQAGNAFDPLMRRLHGPRWRQRAEVPAGRRPRHLAVTAAGVAGVAAAATGHRRLAALALAGWAAGTAEFAIARIRPGPRTPAEVAAMAVTSLALPPLAAARWLRGLIRYRGVR